MTQLQESKRPGNYDAGFFLFYNSSISNVTLFMVYIFYREIPALLNKACILNKSLSMPLHKYF